MQEMIDLILGMLEINSNSVLICYLCFQLLERVQINTKSIFLKFQLFSVSRMVNLTSVELSGELITIFYNGTSLKQIFIWHLS